MQGQFTKTSMSIINDKSPAQIKFHNKASTNYAVKNYEDLFAHVTTVNVLIAEPTIPARIAPNTAWFTTISGSTLPSHDTAFGTTR